MADPEFQRGISVNPRGARVHVPSSLPPWSATEPLTTINMCTFITIHDVTSMWFKRNMTKYTYFSVLVEKSFDFRWLDATGQLSNTDVWRCGDWLRTCNTLWLYYIGRLGYRYESWLGFQTWWLHSNVTSMFTMHRIGLGSLLPVSAQVMILSPHPYPSPEICLSHCWNVQDNIGDKFCIKSW